jgi:hypothetical protein
MTETNDRQGGFKVVDKRRFAQDDEPETASTHAAAGEPKPAAQTESKAPQPEESAGRNDGLPPVDFTWFVVSLATQAMVLLGEVPDPQTNQRALNLDAARQTIDILGILADKTKGNLSAEEDRLLQDVLANLRMSFVTKVRKAG